MTDKQLYDAENALITLAEIYRISIKQLTALIDSGIQSNIYRTTYITRNTEHIHSTIEDEIYTLYPYENGLFD